MGILDSLKDWAGTGGRTSFSAAAQLPVQPPPKVKPKQITLPSSFPNAAPNEKALLVRKELSLASTSILTLRYGATTADVLRDLARASPDLSAALSANLRLAIPEGWKMKAWNPDGTFNVDATKLAYQIAQRMDMVPDYSEGFNTTNSFATLSATLGRNGMLTGALSMELVLDKSRLPQKFVPIATSQIQWYPDVSGKGVTPKQLLGGKEIDLDIPTFFYVPLDQDVLTAYAASPFEAAIQPVLADGEFTDDMRRVIKRAAHPRLDISIDQEKWLKALPPDVINDPVKLRAARAETQDDVAATINGLAPEDALIHFDSITPAFVNNNSNQPHEVFKGVQDLINAKLATGAKTPPSVLGHGSGSQNVASSETLLALKTADGYVRRPLNELYSKGMTLAVRLFGLDVAVSFEFDAIDLRPTVELEAFRAQKQARILELLSLGLMTDEEACIDLTGALPPAGMKPLTGTGFAAAQPAQGNDYSNTGAGGASNGDASQKANKSNAPTKKQGGNGI